MAYPSSQKPLYLPLVWSSVHQKADFQQTDFSQIKPFQDFISIKEITQLNNRVEEKEEEWRRGEEEEKREV